MEPKDLPPEFDPKVYKELHGDLQHMDATQLRTHYLEFGETEGRRSHVLSNRIEFSALASGSILEIGPFASPTMVGEYVQYADIYSSVELRHRASELGLEVSNVPEINWVVRPTDLSGISEAFDCVFSSHNVEHQPNFFLHLQQVERLLRDKGRYLIAVPDHRYCFDHFKPVSTIDEILGAYLERDEVHSARSVIQRLRLVTHNDAIRHWDGDHGVVGINPDYPDLKGAELVRQAIAEYELMGSAPMNEHSWFFTPSSFREIIDVANEIGITSLGVERLYPTLRGGIEFWVVLRKNP